MYPIHEVPENKLTQYQGAPLSEPCILQPFHLQDPPYAYGHCNSPSAWFPAPGTLFDDDDGQYLINKIVKCRPHGHQPAGGHGELHQRRGAALVQEEPRAVGQQRPAAAAHAPRQQPQRQPVRDVAQACVMLTGCRLRSWLVASR